jgi:hypothetical protein
MNFETLQPALVTWVKALTGLDVVVFENEPRPMHNGAIGVLSWTSNVGVGQDETRWDDDGSTAPSPPWDGTGDAPTPNLTPVQVGNRLLALQVSIETHNTKPDAPHALALAERLRARARRPSSLASLEAMNLGLVDVQTTARADYRGVDQRWIARVVSEVRFNATSFEQDSDGATYSIETVGVTATLTDPAGESLAPSLQLSGEVMP